MKSVLALDVSKRATGFAFGLPDHVPITGLIGFDGQCPDEVWVKAAAWISGQLKVLAPDELAIEAKILSTGNSGLQTDAETQEVLWGLQTVFRTYWFNRTGRKADLIASSTARKALCGKGRFEKGEAKDAVQAECIRRGWLDLETVQGDKADALAVWCCKAAEQIPELAFNPPKRRKAQAAALPGVF